MNSGLIYKALSGFYYVESDGIKYECRERGRLQLDGTYPLVGDRVRFEILDNYKGMITEILPRRNFFIRPPVANVDSMVVVASETIPVTEPFLIDRIAAIAGSRNCEVIVCINKADIAPGDRLYNIYENAGYKTVKTSAETGEGISELFGLLENKTCVLTGNSGVGKSSILNWFDSSFDIKVDDVSKKLGRGKHTTRSVELYRLKNNALVADTPGFSSFQLDDMEKVLKEDLHLSFPDFAPFIAGCRFNDCAHINEPGCAVRDALFNGKIEKTRYDSYVKLVQIENNRKRY
jgi:ribosome biogenesis GTPase